MLIKRIVLENFGKWKDYVVDFGDRSRLYVVSGRNGAGKSTIFVESLVWCFYGDSWRGMSSDGVIKDGVDKCRVVVEMDKGIISREKVRGRGNVVKVNGKLAGDRDLEGLVGLSKEAFFNAVVFGSALSGFMFLSEGDRREVLAEFIQRDVDMVVERLKVKKSEIDKEIKFVSREKDYLDGRLKEIEGRLEELRIDNGSFKEIEEKKSKLEESVGGLEKELKELVEEKDGCSKEVEKLRNELDRKRNEKMKIEVELVEVEERYRAEEGKIKRLKELDVCPVCFQKVGEEHKQEVEKEIDLLLEELNEKIKKLRGEKDEVVSDLKKLEENLSKLKELLNKLEKLVKEIYVVLENEKGNLDRVLKEYNELSKVKVLHDELKREKDVVDKRLKELEKELSYKGLVVQACEWWIGRLTNFKREVFDRVLEDFEKVANEFLMRLNPRFGVKLDYGVGGKKKITEKFALKVLDDGKEVDFKRLSGGEKRIVTLALNLTLNYVLSSVYAEDWNLMVFDEVFDGLDSGVRERVTDLLLDMVKWSGKNIVVITHDDFSYRETEFERIIV